MEQGLEGGAVNVIFIFIDLKHLSIEFYYQNLHTLLVLYSFLKESAVITFHVHPGFLT